MSAAYTYTFHDTFEESVFNAGPLSSDSVFKELIQSKAECMGNVIKYNEGIPNITSLIEYKNKSYLIKVVRS